LASDSPHLTLTKNPGLPLPSRSPRLLLFTYAGLDLLGLLLLILLIALSNHIPLTSQLGWLCFTASTYLVLGWLFGTYTVMRWRRMPRRALLQRVITTGLATMAIVALARFVLNPDPSVWLVHRSTQALWLAPMMAWSVLVRALVRRGLLLPPPPTCVLAGSPEEVQPVLDAFQRTPVRQSLRCMSLQEALVQPPPLFLAVCGPVQRDSDQWRGLQLIEARDPREFKLITPMGLVERQLERFPPQLVPDLWLEFDDLPWARTFSLDRQLKRIADVLLASVLLLIFTPLIIFLMLLIWLDDRGPVIYSQERSGWLGSPFLLYKLRTMHHSDVVESLLWTSPSDKRITRVGLWLRRFRLDELPQLVNVIFGDMSLIGPRPERPEFEAQLEERIPHYRKRHWMRPGMSGWAQVCAPYASSIEDSELKLSYDLYYLKNFSIWLDVIVLVRTIKTILKAQGR